MTRTIFTRVEVECDHHCMTSHGCLQAVDWTPDRWHLDCPEGWYQDTEGWQHWVEGEEPADICAPCWRLESQWAHQDWCPQKGVPSHYPDEDCWMADARMKGRQPGPAITIVDVSVETKQPSGRRENT